VPFSDAIELISGGTPKTSVSKYWGGNIPWLSVGDFNTGYRWVSSAEKSITEQGLSESATTILNIGDIIISARGTVGVVAQIAKPMAFNQSCYGIRGKKSVADTNFIYYSLKHAVSQMKQVAHGGVFATIIRDTFNYIETSLPPLNEQQAIAHILGTLDDKIELNRRMNETLEGIARAIFKSWFVDFDPVRAKAEGRDTELPKHIADLFPSRLVDSELGEIPEGWNWCSLYDLAKYVNGAAFRNAHFTNEEGALPIVKIAELKSGVTDQTKFTKAMLDDKYRIDNGEILLSWSGNPDTSIDTFVWCGGAAWLNQHIFRVLPHQEIEKYFIFYLLKYLRPIFAEIARNKQTTGLGHFTIQDMKQLMIAYPLQDILHKFNDFARPIFDRWYKNLFESKTIHSIRETLLPKLISGELRVPDAERIVGRCA